MVPRPIFVATHPRACSTAFERVFLKCRDVLDSQHEPFGDAFYFGPEALSERYRDDPSAHDGSRPEALATYQSVLDHISDVEKQGKRVFIKDMAYYLFPPEGRPAVIAPSISSSGSEEPGNLTVVPLDVLRRFHFAFLIRDPRRSIPSFYKCTTPPLSDITGFTQLLLGETGYKELALLFDMLARENIIDLDHVTVIDADDLLDNPEQTIRQFCARVGLEFDPCMLVWDDEDRKYATKLFEKWNGWHNDVLASSRLNGRSHAQKTSSTVESENKEWTEKFGPEGQKRIREAVDASLPYYDHLKKYCMRIEDE